MKNQRGGDRNVHVLLPCLRAKMIAANATVEALAEASGVSKMPIRTALNGGRIRLKNGLWIMEALNTRQFKRSNCGAHL